MLKNVHFQKFTTRVEKMKCGVSLGGVIFEKDYPLPLRD